MFQSWWMRLFARRHENTRRRSRPQVELLEDRTVPSTVTWDGGGGSSDWHNPLNWNHPGAVDPDTVPGANDDVSIGAGFTVVHNSGTTVIQRLESQGVFELAGGNLTVDVAASLQDFTLTGGVLAGGEVTVSGTITLSRGTLDGVRMINAGPSGLWTGIIALTNGAEFVNIGTLECHGGTTPTNGADFRGGASGSFYNYGRIVKTQGAFGGAISVPLENDGEIVVEVGDFQIGNHGLQTNSRGDFRAEPGTFVYLVGNLFFDQDSTFEVAGVQHYFSNATFAGTYRASTTELAAGRATFTATARVDIQGSKLLGQGGIGEVVSPDFDLSVASYDSPLEFDEVSLTSTAVTTRGEVHFTRRAFFEHDATWNSTGDLVIDPDAAAEVNSLTTNQTLLNRGSLVLNGGLAVGDGKTLVNDVGAAFTVHAGSGIHGSAAALVNRAAIELVGTSPRSTRFTLAYEGREGSLVHIAEGRLALEGGGVLAGGHHGARILGEAGTLLVVGSLSPGARAFALLPGATVVGNDVDFFGPVRLVLGADSTAVSFAGTIRLVSALSVELDETFVAFPNDPVTILNNEGVIDSAHPTFAGLPEGATLTVSGLPFAISYVGEGNDITLTLVASGIIHDGETLIVPGTAGDDSFILTPIGGLNSNTIKVTLNGVERIFSPVVTIRLFGGAGNDAVVIEGTSNGKADAFLVDGSAVAVNKFRVEQHSVESVRLDGTDGNDTLTGTDTQGDNTWVILERNGGTLNSVRFASMENLTGGRGRDTFQFLPGGEITGQVDGAAGVNVLDYSAYGSAVTVTLRTERPNKVTPSLGGGWGNIAQVIGSQLSDTLVSAPLNTTWAITGENAGTVDAPAENGTLAFAGFENLSGRSGVDRFKFFPAGSTGSVDGGGGGNELDYSAFGNPVSVNLGSRTSNAIATTWANIRRFAGTNAPDTTLNAANNAHNLWNISGVNGGTVNNFEFVGFANLRGGSSEDRFDFKSDAAVTGVIDGGGSVNRLNYSEYETGIYVNLLTSSATGTAGIVNINHVFGGRGHDILVGNHTLNNLSGQGGRNLIIGGGNSQPGRDGLDAGNGSGDILIAGITIYDRNPAALNALLGKWADTSLRFSARVAALLTGVSYQDESGTHVAVLDADPDSATVLPPALGSLSELTGGSGLDWFFATVADHVRQNKRGDLLWTL